MSGPSEVTNEADLRIQIRPGRGEPRTRTRSVLFVTYYYPPAGGPGVQRSLKFTRYLPDYGWNPIVVTVRPEDAAYPARDQTLLEEVPAELSVKRTRSWDPYAAYAALTGRTKNESVGVSFIGETHPGWKERLGRWIRANIFIPDARVGWVPYAVSECRRLLKERPVDAILTTGPPHSTHLVGYWISRRRNLPWLADLRDPWTDIDFYSMLPVSLPARKIDSFIERKVLSAADMVTVVGPGMVDVLGRRSGRDYRVIYNGFDPADFSSNRVEVDRSRFTIGHIGSISGARNPAAFWEALASLKTEEVSDHLVVRLVGPVDPVVRADVERHGLRDLVEYVPYLPHPEAVMEMQRSALLLLAIHRVPGAEGIPTGKLFEYIGSGRPILGVGPPTGDAARLIEEAGAGEMHCFDCPSDIAEAIRRHYLMWRRRSPVRGASQDRAKAFSRVGQAAQLAEYLELAVERRLRPGPVD